MPKLKPVSKKIAKELKDLDMELMEDILITDRPVVCCPFCFELHGQHMPSIQSLKVSYWYSCGNCGLTVSLQ
jgi:hypothetical protein|tara:strand:+ start:69 stop:284 length:216 start_codon:yes stop_codon:yes gene_type:complete